MVPRYKNGVAVTEEEADILAQAFGYRSWKEMEAQAEGASKYRERRYGR